MELVSKKLNINFMGCRLIAFTGSILLIAYSFFVWFEQGEGKYGLDFLGGAEIIAHFEKGVEIAAIRDGLKKGGFEDTVVQSFENKTSDFTIKLKAGNESGIGDKVKGLLQFPGNKIEILKEDYVGPIIGKQIRKDGLIAIFFSLIGILAYVSARFEWRFALGGVLALFHDVIIATGMLLLNGGQINAPVLAALLTIVGYSINDTIIIFDRIRENYNLALRKKKGEAVDLEQIMNHSINETLSRTILTSLTVFFVVLMLWIYGGGALRDLSFTLLVGVVVGTYSSIYIASSVVLLLTPKKA